MENRLRVKVLGQCVICTDIPSISIWPWTEQLKSKKIVNWAKADFNLRIGDNENYFRVDDNGRGWLRSNFEQMMTVLSLHMKESIAILWKMDVLGLTEPSEKQSREG